MIDTWQITKDSLHQGRAYTRLVEDLQRGIEQGRFAPGDRLPTSSELCDEYSISINSVRRGIAVLEDRGLLVRRQGSGTYVQKPTVTQQPIVERTTMAVLWQTALRTYHPYFSEMRKGVEETLRRNGWAIWTIELDVESSPNDIAWNSFAGTDLAKRFQEHPELAGAVIGSHLFTTCLAGKELNFPVVAEAPNTHIPYASYVWRDEMEEGLRCLLRQGCRRLAIMNLRSEAPTQELVKRASASVGVDPNDVHMIDLPRPRCGRVLSHWIRDSYDIMRRVLETGEHFDGLMIDDDFCAQGILDALGEHGTVEHDDIAIAIMISRGTSIHTSRPFASLVADGYLHGKTVAELLLAQLRDPTVAPATITLRGLIQKPPTWELT